MPFEFLKFLTLRSLRLSKFQTERRISRPRNFQFLQLGRLRSGISLPWRFLGLPVFIPICRNYFSGILTEELDDEARPSLSAIAFSDQINGRSHGMQILNELMKIKNGRGGRVRLISKTFLSP